MFRAGQRIARPSQRSMRALKMVRQHIQCGFIGCVDVACENLRAHLCCRSEFGRVLVEASGRPSDWLGCVTVVATKLVPASVWLCESLPRNRFLGMRESRTSQVPIPHLQPSYLSS